MDGQQIGRALYIQWGFYSAIKTTNACYSVDKSEKHAKEKPKHNKSHTA